MESVILEGNKSIWKKICFDKNIFRYVLEGHISNSTPFIVTNVRKKNVYLRKST